MVDLPSVLPSTKMQIEETTFKAAVSEYTMQKIGQTINALIDLRTLSLLQNYTSPGSYTYIVGPNTFCVFVVGAGGGGGGGACNNQLSSTTGHGFGGSASLPRTTIFSVNPGDSISVVVGGGGAGGSASLIGVVASGSGGSSTYFNGVEISAGGKPGFALGQVFLASGAENGQQGAYNGYGSGGAGATGSSGGSINASAGAGGFLEIYGFGI